MARLVISLALTFYDIRTNSGNSNAHYFCVEKQEKLTGSRLSYDLRFQINKVFRYSSVGWIFPHFIDSRK